MRTRLAAALIILAAGLCAPTVSWAQEQTGSIEGFVRDAQGGYLPGSTVEALNTIVGAVLTVKSDEKGAFRFAALAPGHYDVTVTMAGFKAQRFSRVEVLLGQIKTLEFTLGLSEFTDQVDVVATSPLMDVKQSARGFSLREEQLALLPRGVDFTATVPLMPGSNNEPKLGGLSIDGSSAAENRFIVDGMNTSDVWVGVSAYPVSVDSVEEIQVKSSGYAAEFGGSTGGVINVITKSGTNNWRGDARLYFSGDVLDAGYRPTLRRNLQDSSTAEYVTYPEDPYTTVEPAGSIGGPIARNRAWFYLSYQPRIRHQTRTVTFNAPYEGTGTFEQSRYTNLFSASQTSQLGAKVRTRAAVTGSVEPVIGVLPAQAGSDPPTAQFDIRDTFAGWSVSGTADWLMSPQLFVTGRVGYFGVNFERSNIHEVPRFYFVRSNVDLLDVPESLQRVTGFSNERSILKGWDHDRRLGLQVDVTWYLRLAGDHTVKGGVQAEWASIDVDQAQVRPYVGLLWNRSLLGQRGRYGYYYVISNSKDPRRGNAFLGVAEGHTPGLFVQDAWTIGKRLTVNVGVRSEAETVPSYAPRGEEAPPIIEFGFNDKVAPRLGAAWDMLGDGRWKLYGSWGVFYDTFKYDVSGSFGAIDQLNYYYTLDTYEWPTLVDGAGCPPACPGQLIIGPVNQFENAEIPIDPALRPMKLQEATLGLEHQVRPDLSVAARYVHKQLDRAVEDIGARDASYNEVYTMANPGFGEATFAFPDVPLPRAKRDYDAIELTLRRPLAGRWSLNASYLWSRLSGNMSGLSQSDEEGRVAPNVGRVYDYPAMMFDEKGRPVYGPLATDRPHQFKVLGTYATGSGLTGSVYQFVASGLPVTREAGILPPNNYPLMYRGRLSDGRTPALSQTDLYIQQEFRLSSRTRFSVSLGITNLFNQWTDISVYKLETDLGAGINLDEAEFYAGRLDFTQLMAEQHVPKDPRFLMPMAFQAPRAAKVMLRYAF